ncbi:MAG: FAD-dependent oxidoreductase [Acidimicrobiia bacterium]|nr:FAD-dependent oxidoreductase [Acidimicrobiia bacterium]
MSTVGRRRIAVVGGGILGLTIALRLAGPDNEVTIIEAAPELGGLASPWEIDGLVWDRHYHVTLLSDAHTRGLLRELGLEHEMRWVETKTGYYAGGRLYPSSNTIEYLRLPLRMIDKLRIAATIIVVSRLDRWQRLEEIGLEKWLRRWSGRRALESFWRPQLRAKLGDSYREASAAFLWATVQRLYAARRSGLKKELFGYVPGGYAAILARCSEVLEGRGWRSAWTRRSRESSPEPTGWSYRSGTAEPPTSTTWW